MKIKNKCPTRPTFYNMSDNQNIIFLNKITTVIPRYLLAFLILSKATATLESFPIRSDNPTSRKKNKLCIISVVAIFIVRV